jgi:hypothetical protein
VVQENASVSFDSANPVAVKVLSDGGVSGDISLVTYISETTPDMAAATPFPGDINLAEFSVTLSPVGPGSPVPGNCVRSTVSGTGYSAQLPVTCLFSGVSVNTYTVEVVVNGSYYTGQAEESLVVFDPSLGFTTGGGWFYWPGTENNASGYPGDKTNFGYTMKYNKNLTSIKGNLLLIRHRSDGSIYRIKSNSISGLAVGEDNVNGFGWATFSGKATYIEPGWTDAVGNHSFNVYVEDRNEPGTGNDRVWIQTSDKNGIQIESMSMPEPAANNTVLLGGGNIVSPHSTGQ